MRFTSFSILLTFFAFSVYAEEAKPTSFFSTVQTLCKLKLNQLEEPSPENEKALKLQQAYLHRNYKNKSDEDVVKVKEKIKTCIKVKEFQDKKSLKKKAQPKENSLHKDLEGLCIAKLNYLKKPTRLSKKKLTQEQKLIASRYPNKTNEDLANIKKSIPKCQEIQTFQEKNAGDSTKNKRWVSKDIKKNKEAQTPKVKKVKPPEKLKMYLNISVGPTRSTFVGPLSGQGIYGLAFDFFYVIPAKSLKKHNENLPGFLKSTKSPDEDYLLHEMNLLTLLPTHVTISPAIEGDTQVYGITFGALGFFKTFGGANSFNLRAGVKLPIVTYEYINSNLLEKTTHFVGVGSTLELQGIYKVSEQVRMSLEWQGNLYLPLENTKMTPVNSNHSETIWYKNTFGILFHYYLPWTKGL